MRHKIKNLRWLLLVFFVIAMIFNYIDRSSLSIALSLISSEFHLNAALAGVISSCFFWTYTFMQLPAGWLVKKLQPRKTISIALIGWGIVQALTAVAASFNVFMWFRLLLGIFEGPVQVAMNTSTLRWLRKDERGRASTIIDSGGPLGSAIGSLLVTGLIIWLGTWHAAFIFLGCITILIGILAMVFIRNNPADHPAITEEESTYLADGVAEEEKAEEQLAKEGTKDLTINVFKRLSPWMLLVAFAAYDAVQYGLLTWGPYYISQSLHVSFGITGVASMIVYLGGFVGEMVVGQAADRWRRSGTSPNIVMRSLFIIAGAGVIITTLLLNVVSSVAVAIGLLTVACFFTRWGGLYWSVPQMIVKRGNMPSLSGAMNFAGNVMGILIPIIVGAIVEVSGGSFTGVFILFAGCGVVMALSSAFINYTSKGKLNAAAAATTNDAVTA